MTAPRLRTHQTQENTPAKVLMPPTIPIIFNSFESHSAFIFGNALVKNLNTSVQIVCEPRQLYLHKSICKKRVSTQDS